MKNDNRDEMIAALTYQTEQFSLHIHHLRTSLYMTRFVMRNLIYRGNESDRAAALRILDNNYESPRCNEAALRDNKS
jgi:hypothetical protein